MIGHGYFTSLKKEASISALETIFANKVIPLLQEYFYDDWEKIRLVLGDNQKKDKTLQFIMENNPTKLFGKGNEGMESGKKIYRKNPSALRNPEAYKKIYEFPSEDNNDGASE